MYPFILTILAGFATLLGTIPIFVKIKNTNNLIAATCSFASAVMICVSILDLIPESLKYLSSHFSNILLIIISFISVTLGIILSSIIDAYIDSHSKTNNLYKVGILSMIAIILHNIPEGIVTYIVSSKNIFLGISICIAIALHNIPEGISIAVPIYYSTKSKSKAILYTLISALSEPLGAILTYLFLEKYITNTILGILFSLIAGIMLNISFSKLLPVSNTYNKNKILIPFIIGFITMTISLIIFN